MKLHTIEYRYDPKRYSFGRKWRKWKNYDTEADRDKALECLLTKAKTGIVKMQYRKGQ